VNLIQPSKFSLANWIFMKFSDARLLTRGQLGVNCWQEKAGSSLKCQPQDFRAEV
jgi:hypothetical protein